MSHAGQPGGEPVKDIGIAINWGRVIIRPYVLASGALSPHLTVVAIW